MNVKIDERELKIKRYNEFKLKSSKKKDNLTFAINEIRDIYDELSPDYSDNVDLAVGKIVARMSREKNDIKSSLEVQRVKARKEGLI